MTSFLWKMKPHRFSFFLSFPISFRRKTRKLCIVRCGALILADGKQFSTLNKWNFLSLLPMIPKRFSSDFMTSLGEILRSFVRCCYRVGREKERKWKIVSMTPTLVLVETQQTIVSTARSPTTTKNRGMTEREHILFTFTFIWRHRKLIEKFSHEIFIAMNLNSGEPALNSCLFIKFF